jgi:hypothetical protein
VIFGNNATNLAIKLIASTAKGRGFVLPSEIAYIETLVTQDNVSISKNTSLS